MKRYRTVALSLAALFVIYILLGFFAVPPLVKSQLTRYVETTLKHKLTVGEIRFNPLTLAAEVNELNLSEPSGAPLLSFKRLFVNFQLSSLFRRAWTFAEVTLDAPAVTAELHADGKFNFSALLDALRPPEAKPDEPLPRLEIDLIKLAGGAVNLADLQAGKDARLKLAPIDFELTDLSTMPSEKAPYKLAARTVAGERIEWSGAITLNPIGSTGSLTLTGWKVATMTKLMGNRIGIDHAEGELGIVSNYHAAYEKGTPTITLTNSEVKLNKLALGLKEAKAPMIALDTLALSGIRLDLASRAVSAESLDLGKGRVSLGFSADGQANWNVLIPKVAPKEAQTASSASVASNAKRTPWQARIGQSKLTISVPNSPINALTDH